MASQPPIAEALGSSGREPPAPAGTWESRKQRAFLGSILVAAALVLSPSLDNDFILDDRTQILNNRYLGEWSFPFRSLVNDVLWFRDPRHLPQCPHYRPMHDIWLWLNFHLFGFNPIGWHAAMMALHLIVVWLVFRVAALLTENRRTGLLAAALFALTPINAEAATWPAAVSAPLAAAFELGAFELYLRRRPHWRALSMALFGGALLSYESAIAFPALVAAYAWLFSKTNLTPCPPLPPGEGKHKVTNSPLPLEGGAAALSAAWPYLVEAAAYLLILRWVVGSGIHPNPSLPVTAIAAVLTIPGALADYLTLLAMPWRAGPSHPLQFERSVTAPGFYLPLLALAALCGLCFFALRNHPFDSAQGRPHRRLYLFCGAWFLITLAPMFSLIWLATYANICDRFLYLPSVGLFVMAADLAIVFSREPRSKLQSTGGNVAHMPPALERGESRQRATIVAIAAGAVLAAYAAMLLHVEHFWHDEVALYSRAAEQFPSPLWRRQLGLALEARGDLASARQELETAVKMAPDDPAALVMLGAALTAERRYGEALEVYRRAARFEPHDWMLNYLTALALHRAGRDREARDECAAALAIAPEEPSVKALMAEIGHGDPPR